MRDFTQLPRANCSRAANCGKPRSTRPRSDTPAQPAVRRSSPIRDLANCWNVAKHNGPKGKQHKSDRSGIWGNMFRALRSTLAAEPFSETQCSENCSSGSCIVDVGTVKTFLLTYRGDLNDREKTRVDCESRNRCPLIGTR
jgi:hypothetical protein